MQRLKITYWCDATKIASITIDIETIDEMFLKKMNKYGIISKKIKHIMTRVSVVRLPVL